MNIEWNKLIIIRLLVIVTKNTIYLKLSNGGLKGRMGKENNLGLINDNQDNFSSDLLGRI